MEESLRRAKSEEIRIPFGVGIAGHVAQTKEIINIKNAYEVSKAFLSVFLLLRFPSPYSHKLFAFYVPFFVLHNKIST